jgi:hypothetical protein
MKHTFKTDQIRDAQQKVWKSFVWFKDECFEVSTIEFYGEYETIVWEIKMDEINPMLGLYENSSLEEHLRLCMSLIKTGKLHARLK